MDEGSETADSETRVSSIAERYGWLAQSSTDESRGRVMSRGGDD